jgi:glucokinase
MNVILGVDVGATTIAAGLVTHDGEIAHSVQRPTHADGPGTAVKALLELVHEQVAEAERRRLVVDGIGVGLPGVLDLATGTMLAAAGNSVPEFERVPVAEEIQRVTGLPAFVENDANALALAEWMFGAGRGTRSLVVLVIGTDVGGGIIVERRLLRGAHGYAGEFHSLPVQLDGEPCYCGGRGCLGAYVGGRALATAAARRLAGGARSSLGALAGGDPANVTAAHVFEAAAGGDEIAGALVKRACIALGAGVAAIVASLNPEMVVITGGVAQSLVRLEDEVRRRVAAYTLAPALARTRLHVTGRTKRDTVRGGAALVLYHRVTGAGPRG